MNKDSAINNVFIGVGSNISPEESVTKALELLAGRIQIRGISTFYRTNALDRPEQPDFLNGVVKIDTEMEPEDLKSKVLLEIENELGRVRMEDKFAPRTLDLDILVFGDLLIDNEEMKVPDPDIETRAFVAVPLLELAPDLILPGSDAKLSEIVNKLEVQNMLADEAFTAELRGRILS